MGMDERTMQTRRQSGRTLTVVRLAAVLAAAIATTAATATGSEAAPARPVGDAVAGAGPQPVVTSVPRAPGAVRPGQRVRLRVRIGNRARSGTARSRVVILRSTDAKASADDAVLVASRPAAVRARGGRWVVLATRVPVDLAPRKPSRLIACVRHRKGPSWTPPRHACRTLPGALAVFTGSSHDVIDGARDLGLLNSDRALVYKLMATLRQPGLPAVFRGDGGRTDATAAMAEARRRLPRMSPALRRKLRPLLLPPMYRRAAAARKARTPRAKAAAFDPCKARVSEWRSVKATGIPVRVWWHGDRRDERDARRIAGALEREIWPKLTSLLGKPLSDAHKLCSGVDAAVDVYLEPLGSTRDGAASTFGTSCGRSPSWVLLHPRAPGGVIAHEFMHVLQFAHARSAPCEDWSYLNDATATWAEDYVYPHGQTEHHRPYLELLADPHVVFGYGDGYPGWVFFKSVTQAAKSPSSIATLYALAANNRPLAALDGALPGGLSKQWPLFARTGWNRPLPSALVESFFSWDRLPLAPPGARRAAALPEGQDTLRSSVDVAMPGLGRQYVDVDLGDPRARRVTFVDPSAQGIDPGLHADAFIRTADGSWRHEDWTGLAEKQFCRDEAGQDVRQVILIHSTTTLPSAQSPGRNVVATDRPAIELEKRCGEPGRYKVLSASFTTRTEGSQTGSQICSSVSGTEDFSGSVVTEYLSPSNALVQEDGESSAHGEIGVPVPAKWRTTLNGCTHPPPTYAEQPCSTTREYLPEPDGTWNMGFTIDADALDAPTARIRWWISDPSIGSLLADDRSCNVVEFRSAFEPSSDLDQTVPMSRFTASGPVTLAFSGGPRTWTSDLLGRPASLRMTWDVEITFVRVDTNGEPL